MSMLKLYRDMSDPVIMPELPGGYSLSRFSSEADIHAWCECLRGGRLIDDLTDEEAFEREILSFKVIVPERDIHFLDYNGEHIGTVTGFIWRDTDRGCLHQVGIRKDFRGRGLAKYLLPAALQALRGRGVTITELVTGENRPAAVRSYLAAGFRPVEYDYMMPERWRAFMQEWDIEKLDMVYFDGSFYKTLYKNVPERKIKFGVFGAGRGRTMMEYCAKADDSTLVAICDKNEKWLAECAEKFGDAVKLYTDFDEFIKDDMDCVILANYANEHAPFAIKAMRAGKHVFSEVLPVQTMKEAVELIETIEETGMEYMYGENCCYMPAPRKMRKLFRAGKFGSFEYGEGEYMHNCEVGWEKITYGDPDHWRNNMSAFYYCTHATGPIIHISGLRPVKVSGFEAPFNARMGRMGAKAGAFGVEIITLENGAPVKCVQGVGPSKYSIWYSVYGSMGNMESARENAKNGAVKTLLMDCDEVEGSGDGKFSDTRTDDDLTETAGDLGHMGSDYYMMYNVVRHLLGNRQADVIDVYEALDMFLPGMFAYFSALEGGRPMDIPDLRNKEEREKWRNDTRCTDPKAAGDMLIPSYSKGNPEIPDETYKKLKEKFENQE